MIVTILQWNTWYKESIGNIATLLRAIQPDIACLQELTGPLDPIDENHRVHIIADALGGYGYQYAIAQTWHGRSDISEQGNGIFSRFPITKKQSYFVQDPTENPLDYTKEGRIYIETEIDLGGTQLTVGTTHLSYADRFVETERKQKEWERLLALSSCHTSRYILTGDFNLTPQSRLIRTLSDHFVHAGPPLTEPSWTTKPFEKDGFVVDTLSYRLDYLFVTSDVRIISTVMLSTDASDHLPVLLTCEVT